MLPAIPSHSRPAADGSARRSPWLPRVRHGVAGPHRRLRHRAPPPGTPLPSEPWPAEREPRWRLRRRALLLACPACPFRALACRAGACPAGACPAACLAAASWTACRAGGPGSPGAGQAACRLGLAAMRPWAASGWPLGRRRRARGRPGLQALSSAALPACRGQRLARGQGRAGSPASSAQRVAVPLPSRSRWSLRGALRIPTSASPPSRRPSGLWT
mmetsp:Transcript_75395/g.221084  ORF Transcript_75395/g.221084 Transcript_75395/m.221084 type:complete len:217 (+) Transcript_75395:42-692(+)